MQHGSEFPSSSRGGCIERRDRVLPATCCRLGHSRLSAAVGTGSRFPFVRLLWALGQGFLGRGYEVILAHSWSEQVGGQAGFKGRGHWGPPEEQAITGHSGKGPADPLKQTWPRPGFARRGLQNAPEGTSAVAWLSGRVLWGSAGRPQLFPPWGTAGAPCLRG